MSISRWKIMAGVLGVSIGGIAAIAAQCPRSEEPRTQRTDDAPLVVEAPKVPPGGAGAKPTPPMTELPAATSTLPPVQVTTDDLKLPLVPAPNSAPVIPPVSLPKVEDKKPDAGTVIPSVPLPVTHGVVPASGTTPVVPVKQEPTVPPLVPDSKPTIPMATGQASTVPPTPPTTSIPSPVEFTKPMPVPDSPPARDPLLTPPAPTVNTPSDVKLTNANAAPPVTTPVTATKFRILLRVGEGEPSFEVKSGDDLMLKVVCEKIDIKSPEKGQSLSAVTASGRVRFVGFGAEGTCDTLSFLAGTGEVSMTGAVKIQVKDKLGRVESELTTDTIKYKLDASAVPGVLKP